MKLEKILDEELLQINKGNLFALKEIMDKKGITFILGAGVSIPAGLPSWDVLLAKMWGRILETDIFELQSDSERDTLPIMDQETMKNITANMINYTKASQISREKIRKNCSSSEPYRSKANQALNGNYEKLFSGMNLLEVAEYINNYVRQNLWLTKGERKEHLCYEVINELLKDSTQITLETDEFIKKNRETILDELAGILRKMEEERTTSTNVITYNYDNLLEFFLMNPSDETKIALGDSAVFREPVIICDIDEDKSNREGRINIYHPHGFMKVIKDGIEKEDTEKIILTESSYYNVEQKAYRWENSVQAKAFLETSCIFIGFSGQDYNFRRMLKNISHEGKDRINNHFIFFCVDPFVEKLFGQEADRRMKDIRIKKLLEEGIKAGKTPDELTEILGEVNGKMREEKKKDEEGYKKEREAFIREVISDSSFAYEKIQLLYILYAQYMYWTGYGLIPIWTTFEELPKRVKWLKEKRG